MNFGSADIKITDPVKDVAKINAAFNILSRLAAHFSKLEGRVSAINKAANDTNSVVSAQPMINNITVTWTGAGLGTGKGTISWSQSAVQHQDGSYKPVASGSISGLSAGTTYWLAWNPAHNTMGAETSAQALLFNAANNPIPNNHLLFSVPTGTETAGATVIGGGGTEPGGWGFVRKNY